MFQKMNKLFFPAILILVAMQIAQIGPAYAEESSSSWILMPESRHSLYRTYTLLYDEQTSLIVRDGGSAIGIIGGYFTVLEATGLPGHPQLSLHGTAASYFAFPTGSGPLLTQAVDARVGLALDFEIDPSNRASLIWTHQSGHLGDDVVNPVLAAKNLGNEILTFRFIHDIDDTARLGASFRPNVSADPTMLVFGAEQFAEWFPWHAAKNPHSMAPFVGFSMEEYGHSSLDLSANFMIGLASGNHLQGTKHPSLRVVMGYYSGTDLRLKFYEFDKTMMKFAYGGIQVDI